MKKLFYTLLCVFSIMSLVPAEVSAAINLPKKVSIGDGASYDAGSAVNMILTEGEKSIGQQRDIEYGVARAVNNGDFTSFEILTTESMNLGTLSKMLDLPLTIPNILPDGATSTYVAYIKYIEKNNPENESFYFSQGFLIKTNNTPFVQIKNINLLHSTGYRFTTQEGPTIYNLEESAKNKELATSTYLEMTFESNQDTIVNPTILFSKLRSEVFSQSYKPEPIAIKKGKTYIVIPLPTFEYIPGVYVGKMSFDGEYLKNTVSLQYIVAGDTVSVGAVAVIQKENKKFFDFQIFGVPVDVYRSDYDPLSVSTKNNIYTVTTDFLDSKTKILYSAKQDVDFSSTTFSVEIPQKYSQVDSIHVSVVSPATGAVVFEATKKIPQNPNQSVNINFITYIVLYVLLIMIASLSMVKGRIKTAIVCFILLGVLFFARNMFALVTMEGYRVGNALVPVPRESIPGFSVPPDSVYPLEQNPSLLLQDDVPNTVYTCGENVNITYKVQYLNCANSVGYLSVGMSQVNAKTAFNARKAVAVTPIAGKLSHEMYSNNSAFYSTNINMLPISSVVLHVAVDQVLLYAHGGDKRIYYGYSEYKIPLKNTCDVVEKICSCSTDRTEICKKANVEVSRTPNAASCALKASCSASVSGTNATFNTIGTGVLGELTYKDTETGLTIDNPHTKSGSVGATIVQKTTITDGFDGKTANSVCSIDIPTTPTTTVCEPNTPGCTSVGTLCTPGTAGCPGGPVCTGPGCPAIPVREKRNPRINVFIPAKTPVRKGESCVYSWTTEDVDSCTISVNGVDMPLKDNGRKGPLSVTTSNGNNQRAVLTCVSEGASDDGEDSTISKTTLCGVLPEVIER